MTINQSTPEGQALARKRADLLAQGEALLSNRSGSLDPSTQLKLDKIFREIERIDSADGQVITTDRERFEAPQHMRRVDPGWGTDAPATRDAALSAIERSAAQVPEQIDDATVERAQALVEQEARIAPAERERIPGLQNPISEFMKVSSDPAYADAFRRFLRDPVHGPAMWSPEERAAFRRVKGWDSLRAMSEGSSSVGGALVPYWLDPSVVLTNNGTVSPIRELATVKTITSNIWHGITSDGVSASWLAEATEMSDASPTLAAPSITAYKGSAYLQASLELIGDTSLSDEIAGLIGDAKNRLEASAFAVGTGSAQPRGIIVASSGNNVAGSSGAAGSADLVAADIFATAEAVPARYRNSGSAFLAAFSTINKIRKLNTGTTTAYQSTFWAEFGEAVPPKLIGYPIYEVSDMDATVVSGSTDDVLLFGDVRSGYFIIDRLGLEIAYNPIVLGSNRRPTGESGWAAFWRTGADSPYSGALRTLRL